MKRWIPLLLVLAVAGCTSTADAPQSEHASSSSVSKTIRHEDTWEAVAWPDQYPTSFDALYPKQWTFHCCGDMDTGSWHHFSPEPFTWDIPEQTPHIRILDHGMALCAEGKEDECNIETIATVTPKEFARRHLQYLDENAWWGSLTHITKNLRAAGTVRFMHFEEPVHVYEGSTESGTPLRVYAVPSSGFFDIVVFHPDRFSPETMQKFFDGLSPRLR